MSQAELRGAERPPGATPDVKGDPPPGEAGTRRARGWARWEPHLLSLPIVLFLSAFFLIPLLRMVILTIWVEAPDGTSSLSLALYRDIFVDQFHRQLIYRTVRLALLTTLVTLVISYPIAMWMREISPKWRGVLAVIMLSPLLMSVVVRTLGWVILLAPRGVVNTYLMQFGFSPGAFLYNERAVVLGLTHVFMGYMVLSLLTSMMKIQDNLLYAAFNLGANRWKAFRRIVLPLSLPGVAAGCVIVFALSASAYVTPVLLGGHATQVMATRIYQLGIAYLEWDAAAAFATVLFLLITAGVLGIMKLAESGKRKVVFQ